MSVSFFVEMGPVASYRFSCACGNYGQSFATYAEASSALRKNVSPLNGCKDEYYCPQSIYIDARHDASDEPEVNMAYSNAATVFSVVPQPLDVAHGEMDAQKFIGLIQAGKDRVSGDVLSGRLDYDSDYVSMRLDQLSEVAEAAIAMNRKVMWG